jgi:hypothetical protein
MHKQASKTELENRRGRKLERDRESQCTDRKGREGERGATQAEAGITITIIITRFQFED